LLLKYHSVLALSTAHNDHSYFPKISAGQVAQNAKCRFIIPNLVQFFTCKNGKPLNNLDLKLYPSFSTLKLRVSSALT
jgi:hypothetical protein